MTTKQRIDVYREFLEKSKNVRTDFDFIYPETESDIDSRIQELEESLISSPENLERHKSLITDILNELKRNLAEYHYDDVDTGTIKDYVKIQNEKFGGRWKKFVI